MPKEKTTGTAPDPTPPDDNAKFSVIIPCYNREKTILDTLDSVAGQNWRPIETVVVDDGSTDKSVDIIEAWAAENASDPHLTLKIFRQKNAGASAARNSGLSLATGAYIQFLDSDDFMSEDRLSRLVQVFRAEDCDFIFTGFQGVNELGEVIERRPGNTRFPPRDLALRGKFWGNSLRCAYRKDLVDRIGPWEEAFPCFEDREYTERALMSSQKPIVIQDILATARRHGNNRLSDTSRTRTGREIRVECERRLLELAKARDDISPAAFSEFRSRIYGLGIRCYASRWPALGRKCGKIASSIDVGLDRKGKQRVIFCSLGLLGGFIYSRLAQLSKALR